MSKSTVPSTRQAATLRNIANRKPPSHGLTGRSAHGGFAKTMQSLWRRKWIASSGGAIHLTVTGEAALAAAEQKYREWEADLARALAHDAELRRAMR